MRILAIEDNEEKSVALESLVFEVDPNATYRSCNNIRSAWAELDSTMYDLVVMDLMMPMLEGGAPQDAGMEILKTIASSRRNSSTRIVALTAYEDLFKNQEREYFASGVLLVLFDPTSNEWKRGILSILARISKLPRCDFVVVCALEVEREALNGTRAEMGLPKTENGLDVRQVKVGSHIGNAVLLPRTGLVDASVIVAAAIERYRPRLIAMTGICAGIEERVKLGQILVCATCWEYQVGKFTAMGFEFEPYQTAITEKVRQALLVLCRCRELTDMVYSGALPRGVVRCHPSLATMVSGSAVVADEGIRSSILKQHRKIDAIEMELAGVFRAVNLLDDSIIVIGVKAVSDFADKRKADNVQEFAARASGLFVVSAIEMLLDRGLYDD